MGTPTITSPPSSAAVSRQRHWYGELGPRGLALAAIVALVVSLNTTAKYLATLPLVEWGIQLVGDFTLHMIVAGAIVLAAAWARHIRPERGAVQAVTVVMAVTIATAIVVLGHAGWITGGTFWTDAPDYHFAWWALAMALDVFRYAFVGLVLTAAWLYLRTEDEHRKAIRRCALDGARMDQQTAEARLQVLEAQIEPHFLFNTLAHVRRLYETDRGRGALMLRSLKDYLAVALPQMRATDSTLGQELHHATAYLDIQQIRMGRRLAFAVDVPEALRNARFPPLMLVTLVENAIKHGIGPLPEGGRIDIGASVDDGRLRVVVADTGRGFTKAGGGGTGLANIRARLASQYGAQGQLAMAINTPRGVIATMELPYERGTTGAPGP